MWGSDAGRRRDESRWGDDEWRCRGAFTGGRGIFNPGAFTCWFVGLVGRGGDGMGTTRGRARTSRGPRRRRWAPAGSRVPRRCTRGAPRGDSRSPARASRGAQPRSCAPWLLLARGGRKTSTAYPPRAPAAARGEVVEISERACSPRGRAEWWTGRARSPRAARRPHYGRARRRARAETTPFG